VATPHDVGVLECPFLSGIEVLVLGPKGAGVADAMIEAPGGPGHGVLLHSGVDRRELRGDHGLKAIVFQMLSCPLKCMAS